MIDVVGAPLPRLLRPVECEYQQIKQKLLNKIEFLEEENNRLRNENQASLIRGDQWRDEKLALQRESDYIIGELKKEIQQLNAALEVHAEDEALLFGISRKLAETGQRLKK